MRVLRAIAACTLVASVGCGVDAGRGASRLSVDGAAPARIRHGEDLTVVLRSTGVRIVAADSKRNRTTGHFHVLVDPRVEPRGGNAIGPAVENHVIHTTEEQILIRGLDKGEHTLWVVLGDGQHYAFDPAVMDELTVTVI